MAKTRREFLAETSLGLVGAAVIGKQQQKPGEPPAGTPPAFGTGPAVGPEVSPATFAEAEKLVQVEMSPADRAIVASSWRGNMAALYERRTGPRKAMIEDTVAPYSHWDPILPGMKRGPERERFLRSPNDAGALPARDEDIAFAPVWKLSRWIETRKITSERLTKIYLERLERFNGKLRCVITLTSELAMAQAKKADTEIAEGKYRGPLHGIPWGAKDLLDTAGIPTTYGAEPFRDRIPAKDAAVV